MDYYDLSYLGYQNLKTNISKSIECFNEMLEIKGYYYDLGNTYAKLGYCYLVLKDYEKAHEYYEKAINDSSFNYTLLSNNSWSSSWEIKQCGYYLLEIKKDKPTFEIFIEKYLKYDSMDCDTIYLKALSLITENDKEYLYYLAKIKKTKATPEVFTEEVNELLTKYDKEINKFIANYWTDGKKELKIKEIATKFNFSNNMTDFILGKAKKLSNYQYVTWKNVFSNLVSELFDLDDKCLNGFYKIFTEKETSSINDLIIIFEKIYGKSTQTIEKIFNIMKNADVDIVVFSGRFGAFYTIYDSEEEDAEKKEYSDFTKKLLTDFLLPKYEKEIFKHLNTLDEYETAEDFFAEILLKYDSNKYINNLKEYCLNFKYSFEMTYKETILSLINDNLFTDKVFINQIDKWFTEIITQKDFKNEKLTKKVIDYLKTGLNFNELKEQLEEFKEINKELNYDGFQHLFLYNDILKNNELHKRIYEISYILNYENVFEHYCDVFLSEHETKELNLDKLIELAKEKRFNIEDFIKYFASEFEEKSDEEEYFDKKSEYLKLISGKFKKECITFIKGDTEEVKFDELYPYLFKTYREDYFPVFFEKIQKATKDEKKVLFKLLSKQEQYFEQYKSLLNAKKADIREIGVKLLSTLKNDEIVEIFKNFYLKEKDNSVKKAINEYFNTRKDIVIDIFTKEVILENAKEFDTPKNTAFNFVKRLKLPKLNWKDDGKELKKEVVYYFINTFLITKSVIPPFEGKAIAKLLDENSLKEFTKAMFEQWDEKSETKWMLGFVSGFGGNEYVDIIFKKIKEFVDNKRGAMAANLVESLAMIGTKKAFQKVDFLIRKEKQKQVKEAAITSIETACAELNIPKDDFLDKVVDDFGFNNEGKLEIDFGTRKFVFKINPELELTIFDESGKELKTLPKANKSDDSEKFKEAESQFKTLKKDLKDQVKMQKERLENGLSKSRLWSKQNWVELFVENSVMKLFAIKLIWGIYKNNKLESSFRYNEDGSYSDINDNTFTIPENCYIGIIHPIELTKEEIDKWHTIMSDYELSQPFKQLDREIYNLPKEKENQNSILDFQGYMFERSTLKQKLTSKGWNTGIPEDAGMFYYYQKDLIDFNLTVILNFMGDTLGYDEGGEVPVYDITFDDKNGDSLLLKDIPAKLFSEIYVELKSIASFGSGFNEKWKECSW